jgi:hypothetical protein
MYAAKDRECEREKEKKGSGGHRRVWGRGREQLDRKGCCSVTAERKEWFFFFVLPMNNEGFFGSTKEVPAHTREEGGGEGSRNGLKGTKKKGKGEVKVQLVN